MAEANVAAAAPQEKDAAAKEKAFTARVAITTAIFAVILSVSSVGGNNAMKDMLLSQQQASDQWSFYQAKAMRQHLYDLERIRYEADLLARGSALAPEARRRFEDLRKGFAERESRYRKDKGAIKREAKKLEKDREENRTKDPYFDLAGVLLQVAIIMASVALLGQSRPMYWFSVGLAAAGTFFTINGFLLFVRIPFMH
jgi:hypothetical protein